MFREKINEFITGIDDTEDGECLDLLEDLVESASRYVYRVNVLEATLMIGKHNRTGEEYRKYTGELDKERTNIHNALISNVKIINRLCRKHNLRVFYNGNEDNRVEVADFAQNLVDELFSTRKI